MSEVLLLTGGNTGNRMKLLSDAADLINNEIGSIIQTSSVYETEPWGFECKNPFLNQVVKLKTELSPQEVLEKILNIEKSLGRKRNSSNYESRLIDIDILFYDDLQIIEEKLQIPHPRLHERKFALIPLTEIAGSFVHPVFEEKLNVLSDKCNDKLNVELYKRINPPATDGF
ncbi:MAG: 2-amino-4-hydroxy-6-hydroxymethyldihydropteridine diphosphokinase [Bacteroidetes bacterium 4484_249]|nr:MAG: 2-amino-4-hydroxy-6-hydroxymethyldihydropteridine diphosphokinase [Bacteroidetes bacterium 4484_249]